MAETENRLRKVLIQDNELQKILQLELEENRQEKEKVQEVQVQIKKRE